MTSERPIPAPLEVFYMLGELFRFQIQQHSTTWMHASVFRWGQPETERLWVAEMEALQWKRAKHQRWETHRYYLQLLVGKGA